MIVASSNAGKLREMQALLAGLPLAVEPLTGDISVRFPPEGIDYEHNALAKALAAADQLGDWALADDSGLEVDGLCGAPGALSARYGGPGLDDAGRVTHLLGELGAVSGARRTARFVCLAALAGPSGERYVTRGECAGTILAAPRGDGGFGYDPIFQPDGFDFSMAELSEEVKNRISHRARAIEQLVPELRTISSPRANA